MDRFCWVWIAISIGGNPDKPVIPTLDTGIEDGLTLNDLIKIDGKRVGRVFIYWCRLDRSDGGLEVGFAGKVVPTRRRS